VQVLVQAQVRVLVQAQVLVQAWESPSARTQVPARPAKGTRQKTIVFSLLSPPLEYIQVYPIFSLSIRLLVPEIGFRLACFHVLGIASCAARINLPFAGFAAGP
jgi:hypothetical protein